MDELKECLLVNLADYTETMHLALEGNDLDSEERLIYLGHLAMCARIFKAVYLNEPAGTLETFRKIETLSYKFGTPRNQRGSIAKEAWDLFLEIFDSYISVLKNV